MKLLIIPLIAIISVNAHAGTCESLSELANAVMKARQHGAPMTRMIKAANLGENESVNKINRDYIVEAYSVSRYSTNEYQTNAINDFTDAKYLECVQAIGSK